MLPDPCSLDLIKFLSALKKATCRINKKKSVSQSASVIQWIFYLSVFLSVSLSVLSVFLFICLSVCLSFCLSVCLCLSVFLSVCLCVCVSVCRSVYLSFCLSVYLSVCLSIEKKTPRIFLKIIVLCSWARHFSLYTVPLSTQVYKWVPANSMLGVTLRWTNIPSKGK